MTRSIENILLCAGLLLIPFDMVFQAGPARVTFAEAALSFAMAAWLARALVDRRRVSLPPALLPIALFVGASFASAAYAAERIIVVREGVQFLWLFALYICVYDMCSAREMFPALTGLLLASGAVAAAAGVYQHFFVREPFDFLISESRLRAHGFFAQPNTLGSFLAGLLPMTLGCYLLSRPDAARGADSRRGAWSNPVLLAGGLFLLSLALLMTFSRGSWLGLAAGALCFVLAVRPHVRFAALRVPLLAAAAAVLVVALSMAGQDRGIDRAFSNRQRILLAGSAAAMFADQPLTGIGSGNFRTRLPEYSSRELDTLLRQSYDPALGNWRYDPAREVEVELAHNVILQLAAETGLVGLCSFAWLFGALLVRAGRFARGAATQRERIIRSSCLAAVCALLFGGMFGWPFSHGVQELLMVTLAVATGPRP